MFVIGAMAIVGALDSGLRGDHSVLYTKAILDGFASVILTTTLGIGVMFSALPVVLYEGGIALLATQIERFVPREVLDSFIAESTATGGILTSLRKKSPTSKREGAPAPVKVGDEFRLALANE
ncbi:hypothetical protein Gste01_02471 [Geobacillus stearothermophilus ATCC 7953]